VKLLKRKLFTNATKPNKLLRRPDKQIFLHREGLGGDLQSPEIAFSIKSRAWPELRMVASEAKFTSRQVWQRIEKHFGLKH